MDERVLLSLVLTKFRGMEPDHPMAVIETDAGEIVRLTYGDLRQLGKELAADRRRANEAAREAADLRDELASTRAELEELRYRYAERCTERDVLTVELEDARAALGGASE